jgi:sulfonate transport system substrate-binding protein
MTLRPWRFIALAAVSTTLLAGCGSSDDDDATATATAAAPAAATGTTAAAEPDLSKVTIKVGVFATQGYDVLLKGAGLDDTPYHVTYVSYQDGGAITTAVNQGTVDLGPGSAVANTLIAAGTGAKFKSIATLKISPYSQNTVVPKGSDVKSVADLKGKKVAYIPNTTSQYFLLRQLQSAGLSFKDITPVPLDPATALSSILGGKVDAYAGFGQPTLLVVAQGGRVLASGETILKGTLGALVGTENAAPGVLEDAGKSAAVADYVARINAAFGWTRANPDTWTGIVAKQTNQKPDAALTYFQASEKVAPSTVGPVEDSAIADQQKIADTFYDAGVLKQKVDVADLYSKQLGPQIAADTAKLKAAHPAYFSDAG